MDDGLFFASYYLFLYSLLVSQIYSAPLELQLSKTTNSLSVSVVHPLGPPKPCYHYESYVFSAAEEIIHGCHLMAVCKDLRADHCNI